MRKQWRLSMSLMVLVAGTPAARAATFTVDSPADAVDAKPGDGTCATPQGACTLRAAIQEANEQGGGTINLNPGTYALSIKPDDTRPPAATGDLDVYGALTLSGAGPATTIVDGGGIDRVFSMQVASRVTLSGVTIRNGQARPGEDGGGIENYGDLTLENVSVSGNKTRADATLGADAPGGGIFNAATLHLRRCTVSGNTAADMGGGIHNKGVLTVMQSTVDQNTTLTDRGGGISNFNKATVILSTIAANTAAGAGGGVENGGGMTITHSTVSGNVGEIGGGLHSVGGLDVTDSTIAGNTARRTGGGIHNERSGGLPGDLKLNGVTIANNTAGEQAPGQPAGGGGFNASPATFQIANTIVAGNRDTGGKGPDCAGTLLSIGYNLVQQTAGCTLAGSQTGNLTGKDPKLGPLANNGGPTQTMALLPGSPAIDAGNPAKPGGGTGACEASDQRGIARPMNGGGEAVCDIGAFEVSK